MKKILMICMTGLTVLIFTGVTFALDDEDDIMTRHEKRMGKMMLTMRSQGIKINNNTQPSINPITSSSNPQADAVTDVTGFEPPPEPVIALPPPEYGPDEILGTLVPVRGSFVPKTLEEVCEAVINTIANNLGVAESNVTVNSVINYAVMGTMLEGGKPYGENGYWLTLETDSYVFQYSYDEISDRLIDEYVISNGVIAPPKHDGIKIRSLKSKNTGVDLLLQADTYTKNNYGQLNPEFSRWEKQENGLISFSYKLSSSDTAELSLKVAYDENGTLREDRFKAIEHYQDGSRATAESTFIYDSQGRFVSEIMIAQGHNSEGGLGSYMFDTITHIPGGISFGIRATCNGREKAEVTATNNYVFSYYENGKYETINGTVNLFIGEWKCYSRNESWVFNEDGSGQVTYRETHYDRNGNIYGDNTYTIYFDKDGNRYEPLISSVDEAIMPPKDYVKDLGGGISEYVHHHPVAPVDNEPTVVTPIKPDVVGELGQRKSVEAQIELKGNGKNYTISGQKADAPQQAIVPVQNKQ